MTEVIETKAELLEESYEENINENSPTVAIKEEDEEIELIDNPEVKVEIVDINVVHDGPFTVNENGEIIQTGHETVESDGPVSKKARKKYDNYRREKLDKYLVQDGRYYQCDKCPYMLDRQRPQFVRNLTSTYEANSRFRNHLEIHKEKSEEFTCTDCQKMFASKSQLRTHVTNVHRIKFKCDKCDFKTSHRESYEDHLIIKHSDQKPSIKCPSCDKLFLTRRKMLNHVTIQHGEKRFECDMCGNKYTTRGLLNGHKKEVHEINEVDCEMCGKTFKNRARLQNHIKYSHEKPERKKAGLKIRYQIQNLSKSASLVSRRFYVTRTTLIFDLTFF